MSPLWLKSLPWSTIISNAPLIVDGAKKLVSLVKSKPAAEEIRPVQHTFAGDPQSEAAALLSRVQRLEEEQRQAAELVRAMAESQAQMTQVLEALRARARVNLRLAVISLVGVAVLLIWILAH
jgi:flagellar hook-basal body complex protein FliE